MTDKYADLRAALDAGPTPGPWFVSETLGFAVASIAKLRVCSDTSTDVSPSIDAAYIAAANPEAIRALLSERDALREALWVATEHNALHFGESHNTVIQGRAALAQEQGD